MKTISGLGVVALILGCGPPFDTDADLRGAMTNDLSWGTGRSATFEAGRCDEEIVDKVGVRFMRLCGSERSDGGWIGSVPLSCSEGAHATIPCPIATPALRALSGGGAESVPREVMLTDAVTAHRTCALRFGGRLPSRAELAELRGRYDGAAVMAHGAVGGRVILDELPEWVGEGGCSHPTLPEGDCRFERKPQVDLTRTLPWSDMLSCHFEPEDSAAEAGARPGGTCSSELGGCVFERKWEGGDGRDVWRARCQVGVFEGDYPKVDAEMAMVRCVVPADAFPEAR